MNSAINSKTALSELFASDLERPRESKKNCVRWILLSVVPISANGSFRHRNSESLLKKIYSFLRQKKNVNSKISQQWKAMVPFVYVVKKAKNCQVVFSLSQQRLVNSRLKGHRTIWEHRCIAGYQQILVGRLLFHSGGMPTEVNFI